MNNLRTNLATLVLMLAVVPIAHATKTSGCVTALGTQRFSGIKDSVLQILNTSFGGDYYNSVRGTAVPNKLSLLSSPELREQIVKAIAGNSYEYFRGMQISGETLLHILEHGMQADRTGYGELYFGKFAATAAYYAIKPTGAIPEQNKPLFPVIFRVNAETLHQEIKDDSILTVKDQLPSQSITGVWILDTRNDGKQEFQDALDIINQLKIQQTPR